VADFRERRYMIHHLISCAGMSIIRQLSKLAASIFAGSDRGAPAFRLGPADASAKKSPSRNLGSTPISFQSPRRAS
jgi:hypothetical protein